MTESIANSLVGFLNDYTTDRRGDIGSLVRLEGIQAAKIALQRKSSITNQSHVQDIVGCLCRLAAEKLDKVRLEAWLCLQAFWETASAFPPLLRYGPAMHLCICADARLGSMNMLTEAGVMSTSVKCRQPTTLYNC